MERIEKHMLKNEVDDNDKPSLKSAIVNCCCVGFVFLVVFVVEF